MPDEAIPADPIPCAEEDEGRNAYLDFWDEPFTDYADDDGSKVVILDDEEADRIRQLFKQDDDARHRLEIEDDEYEARWMRASRPIVAPDPRSKINFRKAVALIGVALLVAAVGLARIPEADSPSPLLWVVALSVGALFASGAILTGPMPTPMK